MALHKYLLETLTAIIYLDQASKSHRKIGTKLNLVILIIITIINQQNRELISPLRATKRVGELLKLNE